MRLFSFISFSQAAQAIGGVVIIALTTIIMISKPTTYGNLFLFSLLVKKTHIYKIYKTCSNEIIIIMLKL